MKKRSINLMLTTVILSSVIFFSSSAKNDVNAQDNHGISNAIPAYYDANLFRIIFVEFPAQAEKSLLAHNPSINIIYRCDAVSGFVSVIDAIPGDGMNAVWQEVQIEFNTLAPQQLYSDNDILAYASSGAIILHPTTEIYVCPVIGKKPR